MKQLIFALFMPLVFFLITGVFAGCSSMPKGTMEQTAAWTKVASASTIAGTVSVRQDSHGVIVVGMKELRIELGKPMVVYPRISPGGSVLELDIYMLGPEYKPGIEAENF